MSLMDVASALTNFPLTVAYLLIPAGGSRSIFRSVRTPFGCAITLTQSGFGRFQIGSRPWLPSHKPTQSRAGSRVRARLMIDTRHHQLLPKRGFQYCRRSGAPARLIRAWAFLKSCSTTGFRIGSTRIKQPRALEPIGACATFATYAVPSTVSPVFNLAISASMARQFLNTPRRRWRKHSTRS